ncbi:MAG TPA: GNAT family N-acetyltransferase [Thermomicrobiales bacterium]|nr:GNAT family N-acetyltransferase [Thermomicrobiales bacterium]
MSEEIHLVDLTVDNWEAVAALVVAPRQEAFVATNMKTIAETQFYPSVRRRVIMAGDRPVGLAAYGIDTDDDNWWLFRFMIAGGEQGTGYGRRALRLLIDEWRAIPECRFVLLGYKPENVVAERLYESMGFVPGEVASWGERIARLDLDRTSDPKGW